MPVQQDIHLKKKKKKKKIKKTSCTAVVVVAQTVTYMYLLPSKRRGKEGPRWPGGSG